MSGKKLNHQQKKILRTASNDSVINVLAGLNRCFRRNRWVSSTNRYIVKTIPKLKRHNLNDVNHNRDLASYIAVSAILHCFDGWIYLGNAISALSSGDAHTSHHLAYYAELRAAMSLLAGEGIGVFSNKHYVRSEEHTSELQSQ